MTNFLSLPAEVISHIMTLCLTGPTSIKLPRNFTSPTNPSLIFPSHPYASLLSLKATNPTTATQAQTLFFQHNTFHVPLNKVFPFIGSIKAQPALPEHFTSLHHLTLRVSVIHMSSSLQGAEVAAMKTVFPGLSSLQFDLYLKDSCAGEKQTREAFEFWVRELQRGLQASWEMYALLKDRGNGRDWDKAKWAVGFDVRVLGACFGEEGPLLNMLVVRHKAMVSVRICFPRQVPEIVVSEALG